MHKGCEKMPRRINKTHKKHHSVETKLQAVKQVIDETRPRMDVAIENQVTLGTLNNWLKRYQIEGEEGLKLKQTSLLPKEGPIEELERLRIIEKKYYEAQEDITILKKFRASLEANESQNVSKQSSN